MGISAAGAANSPGFWQVRAVVVEMEERLSASISLGVSGGASAYSGDFGFTAGFEICGGIGRCEGAKYEMIFLCVALRRRERIDV